MGRIQLLAGLVSVGLLCTHNLDALADAWVQFVKTGSPNGYGQSTWPVYSMLRYEQIDFGNAIAVNPHVTDAQVSFWSQIFDEMRAADCARSEGHRAERLAAGGPSAINGSVSTTR